MRQFFISMKMSVLFGVIMCLVLCLLGVVLPARVIQAQTQDGGLIDIATYAAYGLAIITLLVFYKDFTGKRTLFWALLFLLVAAVLREAGIQHMLTQTDSTAFKIRFFTNPNNPLCEKIRALAILAIVAVVSLYIIIRTALPLIKGLFKGKGLSWTIAGLCATTIVSKCVDRAHGNYYKWTGTHVSEQVMTYLTLAEEGLEMFIPLWAVLACVQHHFLCKKNH